MNVQITLAREGLFSAVFQPDEVAKWYAMFLQRVHDSERHNESSELIQEFLAVFEQYKETCETR